MGSAERMKGANMTPADRRKWERLLAGMLPRSRAFAAEVGPAVFGALRKAILDLSWRHTNPETAGLSDDEMVELIFEYRDRGLVAIPMSRDGDMVSGTIEVLDTATEPVRILEAAFRRQPTLPSLCVPVPERLGLRTHLRDNGRYFIPSPVSH
jgi:hypothetical protein